MRKEVANWGLYPTIDANVYESNSYNEIIHFIKNNESLKNLSFPAKQKVLCGR